MKISGLKTAVSDYRKYNKGGNYSPEYGVLMYNTSTGELWTDYYYSVGHNAWREYEDNSIINLGRMMMESGVEVTMKNVKSFLECQRR